MATYAAGVIGTGEQRGGTDTGGLAMGYRHASAYAAHEDCEVVACTDLVREHAERFASEFDIDEDHIYEDYLEMVAEADLDLVSVTTPIPTHANIVIDLAQTGVSAIHCEKPMATTWGDCRLMAQECDRNDVQLTFNHQLRFDGIAERAKELLEDGTIGTLQRVEAARGDLFESGTHQIDLCNYLAGDVPATWVIGNLDYRDAELKHGVHIEGQTIGLWQYRNGVHGIASTGVGADAVGCWARLRGTEGEMELSPYGGDDLVVTAGGQREAIDCPNRERIEGAVANLIDALERGTEPLLSANNAMIGHEIMFGMYESARRRGRVDLPLRIHDNPLIDMLETGALSPDGLDEL